METLLPNGDVNCAKLEFDYLAIKPFSEYKIVYKYYVLDFDTLQLKIYR